MIFSEIATLFGSMAGSGVIAGAVTAIVYRKQNKKLKENEVKQSSADVEQKEISNDDAQIDLGKKYMESTLEMTQKMQEMMLESDRQRDEYWRKQERKMEEMQSSMDKLAADVSEIKEEQKSEIAFLNGDYKAFKEEMSKKSSQIKTTRYLQRNPSKTTSKTNRKKKEPSIQ